MPRSLPKTGVTRPSVRDIQYTRLLGKVFAATAVSKRALFTPDITNGAVYKLIKRAVDSGHIKEMTYKEHAVDRYHDYVYYTITAKGIRFIADQHFYHWSDYLPPNIQSVSIFPQGRKQSDIACAVRRGDTLLLALNAGACVSSYIFSENIADIEAGHDSPVEPETADAYEGNPDDCDFCLTLDQHDVADNTSQSEDNTLTFSMSLAKVKVETIKNMKDSLCQLPEGRTNELTYFPTREYKALLYSNLQHALKRPDFRYGKYTGVLVAPVMSVLLYHDERDGFKWDNKVEETDINTLCQFSRNCTEYKNAVQGNLRCGIIVANPISFLNIIADRYNKRRKQTVLGKQFNSVYLIPQSPNGARLLSWIATNTQDAKRAYVGLALSNRCTISENQDGRRSTFRLLTNGRYLLDGFEMDYKIIAAAYELKKQSPGLPFSVVCFRWQTEYYRKLWPNIDLLYVD